MRVKRSGVISRKPWGGKLAKFMSRARSYAKEEGLEGAGDIA